VILNRVGSERHRLLVGDAIAALGVPVFGALSRDAAIALPERHLGLVQAGEHDALDGLIARLAMLAKQNIDLDAVVAASEPLAITAATNTSPARALPAPGRRIALAQDRAFSFIYPHLVDAWRRDGAEIFLFSPLADEPPPEQADCCWLPGGYPELHAERLATARRFADGLRHFAQTRPVHGECGGYMALGQSLEDAAGRHHAMAGLLGHSTSFAKRKLHLGYRSARVLSDSILGRAGARVRGHEFHYATLAVGGDDAAFAETFDAEGRALGPAGGRRGHVSGTFFHAIAAME
jgi:cobyrinic acid a,c-diamide synthase